MVVVSMKKALLWTALSIVFSAPMAAHAQRSVYCTNCATSGQASAILGSLNSGFQQVVGAIQGASTANTVAAENAARITSEAAAKNAADMETSRSVIKYEPIDPCSTVAVVNGTTGGSGDVARDRGRPIGRGGGGGGGARPGVSKQMGDALEVAAGAKEPPPPEVQAAVVSRGACESFAQGGVRAAMCTKAGFGASASNGHPNADIRAETLFDGPQKNQGSIVRRLTYKPGSNEETAIEAFLRNIDTAIDLRALSAGELKTDAGRQYMALRDSYEASMSLATKPARDQALMMRASPATKDILKTILQSDDADFVRQYLNNAYPNHANDGISFAELINLEAERRYRNPKWHIRMTSADERQLLQEMVSMQAAHLWMTAMALERLQQIAILQGNVAASSIRAEKLPQLAAAHKAAQR